MPFAGALLVVVAPLRQSLLRERFTGRHLTISLATLLLVIKQVRALRVEAESSLARMSMVRAQAPVTGLSLSVVIALFASLVLITNLSFKIVKV
jgi:hypothetical protein